MSTLRISAADAARSFEVMLERVCDQRDEIEIEADGVILARLVPAIARRNGTLEALFEVLRATARPTDLEAIRAEPFCVADPWAN
jgi:hypothetical protein